MRMRVLRVTVHVFVLSAALLAIPACASAGTRGYVRFGPPAPIVEVHRAAPGPRYVWIGGYHRWDGRAYRWTPGRWVVPPRHRSVWVGSRWVHERRGWHFVKGHWRR